MQGAWLGIGPSELSRIQPSCSGINAGRLDPVQAVARQAAKGEVGGDAEARGTHLQVGQAGAIVDF